jgi:hypothetical protein
MEVVNKFFNDKNINMSMFERGVDHSTVREFELANNISINIYYIAQSGPEQSRLDYISIFNDTDRPKDQIINLGYMNNGRDCHFVLVTKPQCIITRKGKADKKLICTQCCTEFSKKQA